MASWWSLTMRIFLATLSVLLVWLEECAAASPSFSSDVHLSDMVAFTASANAARQYKFETTLWCASNDNRDVIEARWFRRFTYEDDKSRVFPNETGVTMTIDQSGKNASLKLTEPSFNQTGRYTCRLMFEIADKETQQKDIFEECPDIEVTSPPVVVHQHSTRLTKLDPKIHGKRVFEQGSKSVNRGEDEVSLKCQATGYPASQITWFRYSEEEDAQEDEEKPENGEPKADKHQPIKSDDRIAISEEMKKDDGSLLSTLTIYNVTFDDRYIYKCEMKNGESANRITTVKLLLRVKNKWAFIYPLIGIAVVIGVLLAVIIVCELREKKMQRLEEVDAEDDE